MQKHASSHDVARRAGVSQPTVSRALRDDPVVNVDTRRRVREAAEALGYVPSQRGRSLSTRATGQVAVVVSDLGNTFYLEAIQHLHAALDDVGARLVVFTDPPERPPPPERLLDGSVDGVILTTALLDATLPADLSARGLPVVLFNRSVDHAPVDRCVSTNQRGAAGVGEELVRLGHESIGAIFGPQDTSTGRDRERGFRRALTSAGLPLAESRVLHGAFSYTTGEEGLRELWAGDRPSAVFCGNDVIALGALNTARTLGIDVPGDLTIIGFDDIAMAAWPVYELSTVRQDLPAMARVTVELLRERIADPDLPVRTREVETQLVLRGSHASPTKPEASSR
jgi:LacI family transcriptional regulator